MGMAFRDTRPPRVARVAVFLPVDKPFDYIVPEPLKEHTRVGTRVWAPWGSRSIEGVVLALDPPDAPPSPLKPLTRADFAPPVAAELVTLGAWVSEYYLAPPGEVMRLFLP